MKMRWEAILFTFSVVIFSANCLRIVYKNEWQANSNKIYRSRYKTSYYVVLYQTGGLSCDDKELCIMRVQSIQDSHLKKWGKMAYNYLIGEDGNVYEGTGFYEKSQFLGPLKDKCILIAFIGDFKDIKPSDVAWNSLKDLLNFAKQLRYLSDDYALLSSNQVNYDPHLKDEGNTSENLIYQTIKTYSTWKNITLTIEKPIIFNIN